MMKKDYPAAMQFHSDSSYISGKLPARGSLESGLQPFKEYPNCKAIKLPSVKIPDLFFGDLLLERQSTRQFDRQSIGIDKLSNILFAGYGIRGSEKNKGSGERPAPSAGSLYPLELYLLAMNVSELSKGFYHYNPQASKLEFISNNRIDPELLDRIFLQQSWIKDASAIIIATAVMERTLLKYRDRGYRYILLEAGHVFQNMNLTAAAHHIGAVNIGAFLDEELAGLLQINSEDEMPVYVMALGEGKL